MQTENLGITFRAADFPRDGAPSTKRAREVAERVLAEESIRTPLSHSLHSFNDGVLLIIHEPYPLVGDLRAVPSNDPINRDITFDGKTTRRTQWRSDNYRLTPGWALLGTNTE